jgi:hypothetical protein
MKFQDIAASAIARGLFITPNRLREKRPFLPNWQNSGTQDQTLVESRVDCWWLACDFAQTATSAGPQSAFVALGFNQRECQLKVLGVAAGRWRQDKMAEHLMEFIESMRRLTGRKELTCIVELGAGGFGIVDRYSHILTSNR